jgi:hypothetical protein
MKTIVRQDHQQWWSVISPDSRSVVEKMIGDRQTRTSDAKWKRWPLLPRVGASCCKLKRGDEAGNCAGVRAVLFACLRLHASPHIQVKAHSQTQNADFAGISRVFITERGIALVWCAPKARQAGDEPAFCRFARPGRAAKRPEDMVRRQTWHAIKIERWCPSAVITSQAGHTLEGFRLIRRNLK